MKKKYETRNKIIKWFTILVVITFLATVVWSGIVAFISVSSFNKENNIDTLNKFKKINNKQSTITWQLIQQND